LHHSILTFIPVLLQVIERYSPMSLSWSGERVRRRSDLRQALSWRPDSDKFRLLAGILLLLFASYALTFLAITAGRMTGPPRGDFFALWSVARFVFEHPAVEAYDPAALKSAQLALGMDPGTNYPFPYPPSFLLVLAPMGLLPYLTAYVVAMAITLALYVWATVGSRSRWPMVLAALVAPTTTITLIAGQAAFVAAALLAGGFRLAATRPIAAGILFGLATYKPQMGMLVPVALIAARQWRTIAAAGATVVVLVVVTGGVFGPAIWPAWAANIIQYSGQFAAESSAIAYLMPTIAQAAMQLGAASAAAHAAQFAAALVAAGVVWRCFRKPPDNTDTGQLAAAALFVATFLATPHAFVYDMPIVATAVIWFIAERHRSGDAFGTGEIVVMIVAMVAAITIVAGPSDFPLTVIALALLLAMIVRRSEQLRRRPRGVAGAEAARA
jgi:hypothetical protein